LREGGKEGIGEEEREGDAWRGEGKITSATFIPISSLGGEERREKGRLFLCGFACLKEGGYRKIFFPFSFSFPLISPSGMSARGKRKKGKKDLKKKGKKKKRPTLSAYSHSSLLFFIVAPSSQKGGKRGGGEENP